MNCPKCGFVNVIGAKYCIKCGHPLNNYGGNEYNNPPQYTIINQRIIKTYS